MKKIIFLLLLVFAMISCERPIVKNYYTLTGEGAKLYYPQQVFPVLQKSTGALLNIGQGQSGNTPAADHAQGVFYRENAHEYDAQIHELDLGYLTGNTQALVYLEVKVIDHGYNYYLGKYDDEAGQIFFRGKNSKEQWKSVTPRFNLYTESVQILTSDEGKIEWYHEHTFPYLANDMADPQYYIYKWEKIVVNAIWVSNGFVVE